ncbi:MAG: hypothetical protein JWQ44_2935 [Chthoniobacter sp.]|nr:hypothetical protein [Chthoniobacter sp.]
MTFDRTQFTLAKLRSNDVVEYAGAAVWATDDNRRAYLVDMTVKSLVSAADALGYVVMTQAEHEALLGFVENVRDDTPNIVNHRHGGWSRNPEDETPDLMEVDSFRWHQDEAAKLLPKPPKAVVAA